MAGLTLLLGCGKKNVLNDNKDVVKNQTAQVTDQKAGESNTPAADSLKYEVRTFFKTYKGCKETEDNCSYIKMVYPVFTTGKSYEIINRFVNAFLADSIYNTEEGKTNNSLDGLAANFFKDYEVFKNDFPDWGLSYALDLNGAIHLNKNNLVTLEINYYIFTGGAHPNTYLTYFIFNTEIGKLLGVRDIFIKGFEDKLNRLIDKKYREFRGLSGKERLDGEKGMLFENKISYNDNIGLSRDGVTFYYNNYEISAYAVGPTELNFTYKELDEILRSEFKK